MIEKHTTPFVPYEQAQGNVDLPQEILPTTDWTKTQLKEWLDSRSIDYPSDATKAELLTLAGVN